MTLLAKQQLFVRLLIELLIKADALGYDITLGEALRSPEEARRLALLGKGIVNSLHCDKLAIDLNLFKNGKYLSDTEDHRPLGEYWKTLHTLCRWGGDFHDGNHYSIEDGGRK
jgi:hypothetical protein